MCPLGLMIEPEPVLPELGPVGTISRTEAFSARTKLGSRPPAGFGCSAAALGLPGANEIPVGATGVAGGSVGLGGAVAVAAGAVGFAGAVGAGVAVDEIETGRRVGVGVGEVRLSATAFNTSAPVPTIA